MRLHNYIIEETEYLLRVNDPQNEFTFELTGINPVQACGEVGDREFYFHARFNAWSCEVSDSLGQLPSECRCVSDGFFRQGQEVDAGHMPLRKALEIIDRCMGEYFEQVS